MPASSREASPPAKRANDVRGRGFSPVHIARARRRIAAERGGGVIYRHACPESIDEDKGSFVPLASAVPIPVSEYNPSHGSLSARNSHLRDAFLEAILAGDRAGAFTVASRAFEEGIEVLYEDIVRSSLEEVGRLWEENLITVADEHLATATAQAAIASLYPRFPWSAAPGNPTAIIACVEGERHEIGARMVADFLALDGWNDIFLGADTPADALVRKAVETNPAFVALSVSLSLHLPRVREVVARLRKAAPHVKILAGGRAFRDSADAVGADAVGRTARDAPRIAHGWKPAS